MKTWRKRILALMLSGALALPAGSWAAPTEGTGGETLTGEYVVDFDTLQYTGVTHNAQSSKISQELVFWPKGDRTTNWAFGNYSSSYILYLENFRITEVSGSVWLKRAEPKEETA